MRSVPDPTATFAEQLERAQRRLSEKGLLGAPDDLVSVLLPGTGRLLLRQRDDLAARELPFSEASGAAALHAEVYRLRPDAGAIASVSTQSSAALAAPGSHVPIVFDEQARHIGDAWPSTRASRLASALVGGANAGAIDGRWLVIGVTPSRMIFNVELFEKSARAYLLARGGRLERATYRVPWWVCWIAGRRLRRDQQNAARHHAAGRPSPELTAY
jgi:ribulose-5-phosphate 4-epimerase/fuculose-1-phosphate aldolase